MELLKDLAIRAVGTQATDLFGQQKKRRERKVDCGAGKGKTSEGLPYFILVS